MLWVLIDWSLSALCVLSMCSLSALWVLTDCSMPADWSELERWRFRDLIRTLCRTDRQTDNVTPWAPIGAKNLRYYALLPTTTNYHFFISVHCIFSFRKEMTVKFWFAQIRVEWQWNLKHNMSIAFSRHSERLSGAPADTRKISGYCVSSCVGFSQGQE